MGFNCETNAWLIQIQSMTKESTMKNRALSHLFEKESMAFYFIFSYLDYLELHLRRRQSNLVTARHYLLHSVSYLIPAIPRVYLFSHVYPRKEQPDPSVVCFFFLNSKCLGRGLFLRRHIPWPLPNRVRGGTLHRNEP